MEREDDLSKDQAIDNEDVGQSADKEKGYVEEEEEVGVDEIEDQDGVEDEGEEGEEDEMECDVSVEGELNPLDFVTGDSSGVQLYEQFERIEYEALADKKRKVLADASEGERSIKKSRHEEIYGATYEEILEAMNYGVRRKSRKAKKRGRRKGSKKQPNPEITKMIGDANLHFGDGRYEEAISMLINVIKMAPKMPDPYLILGMVYDDMGNKEKAFMCKMLAAWFSPTESVLWKSLLESSMEQGNIAQAWYCLQKAIRADPSDTNLRYTHASLLMEIGNIQKAAESFYQIVKTCPTDVDALRKMMMLYKKCGQLERGLSILEDHLKNSCPEVFLTMVDILVSSYMDCNEYIKALQNIENAKKFFGSEEEFPFDLTVREGICHVHLGDIEKAEVCFSPLRMENANPRIGLTMAVANAFMSLQQYEFALKYYQMLVDCGPKNELCVKIARCYSALKEMGSAILFFYKALQAREDDVDTRLTLASLLLKENREDDALTLLSSLPNQELSNETGTDKSEPWWLNVKVKIKLSYVYKKKGMLEAFVEVIYPMVHESLVINHQKVKRRKRVPESELLERAKILGDQPTDSVFVNFRPPASRSDLLKANRAKKSLLKIQMSKEERKSAAQAAGVDWESDDSDDDIPQQPLKEPPLPDLFKNEEHYELISDLCRVLASLQRFSEALEIIKLVLKTTYKTLPVEKKEKFQSLGAQIAFKTSDPSDGFDYVRYVVRRNPESIPAWNRYYRLVLRLENRLSKHNKFLLRMRLGHKDLVPPMIISGNQFTLISQHQAAAREYLEAYKQMPECPLINLCVGSALVNLALGHRLQNKHQCIAQGLAFLYNNLRLCENSQEALYNIGRAYHHIGLVSLAASYYEKVLSVQQQDFPLPDFIKTRNDRANHSKPGYCNLRREAAYNLHLIYKKSGAIDLARQVLKDYCTV